MHDRVALEMNRFLQEALVPEWMTRGRTTLIQKEHLKETDDVENTNDTNQLRDLFLNNKQQIVTRGTGRMLQRIQRHRKTTLYRLAHPQRDQDKTRKYIYGWIDFKKAYDMVPQSWIINCLKMYKLWNEVINILEKTMKNLESAIDSRRERLAEGKNQIRIFQRDAVWPLQIYNCNNATQPHIKKMYSRIQTYWIAGKDKLPNAYGRHQTVYQKW